MRNIVIRTVLLFALTGWLVASQAVPTAAQVHSTHPPGTQPPTLMPEMGAPVHAPAAPHVEPTPAAAGTTTLPNLADRADLRSAAREADHPFGPPDILVNAAGINIRKQPQDYTLAEYHEVMNTNLTSAFNASQLAYPEMKKAGGGKIINIGSMMSIFGASFTTPYAASKGGIVQMSRAMACAWAKDNIQVNCVLPGWIDTDLTRNARRQVDGLHERVLARTPAGRWGDPGDFAGIAVFLASAASDFVTGTAIPVDGGYSVQG